MQPCPVNKYSGTLLNIFVQFDTIFIQGKYATSNYIFGTPNLSEMLY